MRRGELLETLLADLSTQIIHAVLRENLQELKRLRKDFNDALDIAERKLTYER